MRKMELVDRERYEVLRSMLQDRGQEIAEKMRSLRESLPDELAEVKDPEEQCVDEYVRSLDFALIEMKSHTLARINDALQRLEESTYGMCADCEQPIAAPRLQALPFAERCRDCQESREEIAAEAVRQQSRFASKEPEAPATTDRRPARRAAQPRPTAPEVRRARPGQLELRRQVAGMERTGRRPDVPATATARHEPRRAGVRPTRVTRVTKHA